MDAWFAWHARREAHVYAVRRCGSSLVPRSWRHVAGQRRKRRPREVAAFVYACVTSALVRKRLFAAAWLNSIFMTTLSIVVEDVGVVFTMPFERFSSYISLRSNQGFHLTVVKNTCSTWVAAAVLHSCGRP